MTHLPVQEGTLFYEARPAQAGQPTLLFFPGMGSDGTNYQFRQIITNLPREVGYIALDTLGCGQSQGTMERTVGAILGNYQAVIEREQPAALVLLAHSMGSVYASKYALLEPRVQRVLLIEPTHSGLVHYLEEVLANGQEDYRKAEAARAAGLLAPDSFADAVNPLNTAEDRLENQRLLAQTFGNPAQQSELANHQEILAEMHTVEGAHWNIPVTVVATEERLEEYHSSAYAHFAKIVGLSGNHYLQWSNQQGINELVKTELLNR